MNAFMKENKEYYKYLDEKKIFFQGEYSNDRRNGKGKEYYYTSRYDNDNHLKFEGIYKCGFKEEGKEYYYNDKLLFNGKYKYGVKWDGEGFDENGNIIYKINNGNGFIKEYKYNYDYHNYPNYDHLYLVIEGEYINGQKHGKGEEYDRNGENIFEGEYLNGKRWNGMGKDSNFNDEIIFEGKYLNGKIYDYEYGLKNGKFIEYDIDDNEKRNEIYLIKGSKRKNKRVSLDENYEQNK